MEAAIPTVIGRDILNAIQPLTNASVVKADDRLGQAES